MKKAIVFVSGSVLLLLVGSFIWISCTDANSQSTFAKVTAVADLTATKSDTALEGSAKFTVEKNGKVKMSLWVSIPLLADKTIAVHIHEHGDCGGAGKNAMAHWNPTNKKHGRWGSAEFHLGDIGNITLDDAGKGTVEIETDLWNIGGDMNSNILDKAIIVHSGTDDYTSQPAGNAGTRIGCGVIKKK